MPNVITGTSQNDKITGSTGDEVINALGGFDTITDFGGNDTLSGGDDRDLLIYYTTNQGIKVDLARQTAQDTGGAGIDTLSSIEDIIAQTGRGNDTISGTKGDNRIQTGLGDDTINGRGGDDFLITSGGTKLIDGGDGFDIYQYVSTKVGGVFAGITLSLALQGTVQVSGGLTITLTNIEALDGGRGDDVLTGDDNNNYLFGNGGNDEIHGGGGNDTLIGDGYHAISSYYFDRVVREDPTGGNDKLYGGAGDDSIYGGNGDDLLDAGDGNDRLNGGTGSNILIGGAGDDTYVNVTANDTVTEAAGGGIDKVYTLVDFVLADNIEILVMGGHAIHGTGNADANTINGNSLANVLDGGAGADTLYGGLGSDTYIIDNVGDIVGDYGNGYDTVIASVDYTLSANIERLTLTGAAINGTGNTLANTLTGTDGKNVLDGGAGSDRLIGGLGDDTYIVDLASDRVVELVGGGTDTVLSSAYGYRLGAYVENLTLLNGGVEATGNSLANVLTGNAAANLLDGKGGADIMAGGLGDDTYFVDRAKDVIQEDAGGGTDTVNAMASYTLSANVENLVLLGTAKAGIGNALDNTITGNGYNNTLDGKAGDDTLIGGLGDDTYYVDSAKDVVVEYGFQGTDTVITSVGGYIGDNIENMILTGTAASADGNDLANHIVGNRSSNHIDGGDGDDLIDGGGGNDTLIGNYGFDTLLGGAGDDILYDSIQTDTLKGGTGNDTYRITEDSSTVVIELAGEGTDTVETTLAWTLGDNIENGVANGTGPLHGNALDNVLTAQSTDFGYLFGGAGNDTLIGGHGVDSYHGEAGADRFVILAAADSGTTQLYADEIYDFSAAEGDKIDLRPIDANGSAAGDGKFRFVADFDGAAGALTVTAKSGNWEVKADVNGDKVADMVLVVDSPVALAAGDFLL